MVGESQRADMPASELYHSYVLGGEDKVDELEAPKRSKNKATVNYMRTSRPR